MNQLTRRDLAERGLDALSEQPHGDIKLSAIAGGISFASALEVIEVAKLMAVSGHAVPKHLRNNPGACLRVVFQAVEWRMSPWGVADKSYEVNDRLAYESQLVHAVIEARAPLKHRLVCDYEGEGADRRCIVTGEFSDGTFRGYTTPKLKDIKVKNSPLWASDPDQQLWYYGTRAWSRKWCPDVILGIYSRDELQADPSLGRDEETAPGLHARLVGGNVNREEGYASAVSGQADDADRATHKSVAKASRKPRHSRKTGPEEPTEAEIARSQDALGRLIEEGEAGADPMERQALSNSTITQEGLSNSAERQDAAEAIAQAEPKTPAEYDLYCRLWLSLETSPDEIDNRWSRERQLRNRCGLTLDERDPLVKAKEERVKELAP